VLPIYVPAFMLPPPGEETTEEGSPEESSIIITACRRLAPAPMRIGESGYVPEEAEGKCSACNAEEGGIFVDCVVNWKASLVGGNRCFRVAERCTCVGGGEGEEGSEGD
jgi:hypothetical protein